MMEKILNDHQFEKEALSDLNRMLDAEMAKPEHKREYEKIAEITQACAIIMGDEEEEQAAIEAGILKLERSVKKHPVRVMRRLRYFAVAGVAAVLLLAANIYTVAAYQKDAFSVIVEYTKDSFSVKYTEHETIELPTTPDDPYGIKAECAKYGLENVYAPTYLPEGFELGKCEHHISEGCCTSVNFWFYRDYKEVIQICYDFYENPSAYSSFPCDDFNLSEIEIQGKTAIVSREDGQCILAFRADNHLEISMYMEYLDYQECNKVIASLE